MMKNAPSEFRAIAVALLLATGTVGLPAWALQPGEQAPGFELPGRNGTVTFALAAHPDKVIYVDFWASWCGPCRQSFPWMNAMQQKYGSAGLEVVGINLDAEAKDADAFLAQVPANFTVAFDPGGDSARRFGVKGMPTSFLIGRNGMLIHAHTGFNEDGRKQLEQMIAAAVEATP